jgi:hypothetical protein
LLRPLVMGAKSAERCAPRPKLFPAALRALLPAPSGQDLMIGLLLVTHGNLCVEFKSALEHVVGPQNQLLTIAIGPDDDM